MKTRLLIAILPAALLSSPSAAMYENNIVYESDAVDSFADVVIEMPQSREINSGSKIIVNYEGEWPLSMKGASTDGRGDSPENVRININPNPSAKIILKNFRFEPELYDWDMDMMSYEPNLSNLTFEIETVGFELADASSIDIVESWAFHLNKFEPEICDSYSYMEIEYLPETGRYRYPWAEWGTPFYVKADSGDKRIATSDIYFTSDYITDRAIIDRLKYLESVWGGLPSTPTISNIGFECEEFDWEKDTLTEDSKISFDVYCDGADKIVYYVFDYRDEPFDDNYHTIDARHFGEKSKEKISLDWNDVIRLKGFNSRGVSTEFSEPIRIADYITDPDIKARVDELMNIQTGIKFLSNNENKTLRISEDNLYCADDVRNVRIIDPAGRTVMSSVYKDECISLSFLNPGIYIVIAIDSTGVSNTIRYCKK